jgi:hypothetical protein
MDASDELVWLINQLRNTPEPRERLRLLALGWRSLKDLGPADRVRLARELGFDGAERLVEQLSRRGGVSPSGLLAALRGAEDADYGQLRTMVKGLLDPGKRAETIDRLADEAVARLSDDGALDAAEVVDAVKAASSPEPEYPSSPFLPPPPTRDHGQRQPGVEPTLAAALAAAERDAEQAGQELREPAPPEEEPAAETDVAETELEPEAESRAPETEEVSEPEEPEFEIRAEPEPAAAPVEASVDEPARERGKTVEAEPTAPPPPRREPDVGVRDSVAFLAEEPSVLRRLRKLAAIVETLPDAGVWRLQELIELFPPGWARRRAVETLFRAGLPGDLSSALDMVNALEDGGQRLWVMSTLALSRSFDDDEREELLAAAGSRLMERRLRMRLT